MDDILDDSWLTHNLNAPSLYDFEAQLTADQLLQQIRSQFPSLEAEETTWQPDPEFSFDLAQFQGLEAFLNDTTSSISTPSTHLSDQKSELSDKTLKRKHNPNKVRKSSKSASSAASSATKQPPSIIEKRYRVKLDDHLRELQEIVPLFREKDSSAAAADESLQKDPLTSGLKTTSKRSKASILAKAIEYIKHLEATCRSYESANALMSGCAMS